MKGAVKDYVGLTSRDHCSVLNVMAFLEICCYFCVAVQAVGRFLRNRPKISVIGKKYFLIF